MNASDKLVDAQAEHAHEIEFYKNDVVRRMLTILRAAHSDIRRQIAGDLTEFQESRLDLMIGRVEALIGSAMQQIGREFDAELLDFTASEIAITQAQINSVLGAQLATAPAVQQVYASAMSRPFQGAVLRDWYRDLDESNKKLLRRAIQLGVTNNETITQIIARVREVGLRGERNLAAIIRTSVNHVSTFGRHAYYDNNSDLIRGWYFSATLDSKTTPVCRAADGKFHRLGEGRKPPLHIGCRSADIPILKSNISGVPEGLRASVDGQLPADLTYNQFLRRKLTGGDGVKRNAAFVKEVLGNARFKLFKDGKLDVSKFVNRTGKRLTLAEIRNRNPEAWLKAFGSSDPDAFR